MKFFKKKRCLHYWEITEALQVTLQHDSPAYVVPESNKTNISRICSKCLRKESHVVNGHIDLAKAYKIFGGADEK